MIRGAAGPPSASAGGPERRPASVVVLHGLVALGQPDVRQAFVLVRVHRVVLVVEVDRHELVVEVRRALVRRHVRRVEAVRGALLVDVDRAGAAGLVDRAALVDVGLAEGAGEEVAGPRVLRVVDDLLGRADLDEPPSSMK